MPSWKVLFWPYKRERASLLFTCKFNYLPIAQSLDQLFHVNTSTFEEHFDVYWHTQRWWKWYSSTNTLLPIKRMPMGLVEHCATFFISFLYFFLCITGKRTSSSYRWNVYNPMQIKCPCSLFLEGSLCDYFVGQCGLWFPRHKYTYHLPLSSTPQQVVHEPHVYNSYSVGLLLDCSTHIGTSECSWGVSANSWKVYCCKWWVIGL